MQLGMGIVKLEVKVPELSRALEEFKQNRIAAFEALTTEIKSAVSNTLNQLLNAEMTVFLGKSDQNENKRNGFREREYVLKGIGCIRILFPKDRNGKFQSEIIPSHERIDPRLKEDLAILHLSGISTRTLTLISNRVLGVKVSTDTVSSSLKIIEEKALKWLERPILEDYWALYIDGTNFRLQRRGSTEKEPSLVVLGIHSKGHRSILAIQPGQKDSAECWKIVFGDLKRRGLKTQAIRIGIMDGLPGLETAFREAFPNAMTARCWVHALRNAVAKVPARLEDGFKALAQKVMYASSENAAKEGFLALKQAMGEDGGRAVQCLEKDLESLLVHYRFDSRYWSSLKTTNPIERVNRELKRRTKTMDSVGEKTLNVVCAFTALRMEYQWSRIPVDAKNLGNLEGTKYNQLESAIEKLIH